MNVIILLFAVFEIHSDIYFKLAHIFNGKYLVERENNFVDKVIEDVEVFCSHKCKATCDEDASKICILLFPPLNSKGRFLLHKTIEEYFPKLSTFSICEEPRRRTVIVHKVHLNGEQNLNFHKGASVSQNRKFGTDLHRKQKLNSSSSVFSISSLTDRNHKELGIHKQNSNNYLSSVFSISSLAHKNQKELETPIVSLNEVDSIKSEDEYSVLTQTVNYNGLQNDTVNRCDTVNTKSDTHLKSNTHERDIIHGTVELAPNPNIYSVHIDNYSNPVTHCLCKPSYDLTVLESSLSECENTQLCLSYCECDTQKKKEISKSFHWGNSTSRNSQEGTETKPLADQYPNTILDMSAATMLNDMNSDYLRKKSRQSVPIYRPPGARGSRENQASHPHLDDGRNLQRGHYSQPQQFIGNIRGIHEDLQRSQDVPFDNSPGARESKSKRPDRQFYVPRGRRNPLSVSNTPIPLDDVRPPSPADSICSVVSEFRGRNRYDQQISGRSPVYQERKIMGKPPQMPMNYRSPNKGKNTNNLSPESIKLLERCTNTNSSIMHGNKPESYFIDQPSMGKPVSFNQENNSIHSKENRIDRFEFNNPSERKRKNRRRKSKSRDHSLERGRRRGSLSSENLDRNFYTCESVDWKDNIPKWKQNSRNLSIERIPVNTSDGLEWRKKSASNPSTPLKASLNDCRVQESPIVKDLVDVGPRNSHTSPISHLQKSDILCDSVIENDLMSNPPQLEEFKVSHVPFSSQVNEISKDLEGIEVTKECAPLSCISSENESSVQQVSNFNEQFDISANSFLRGKNLSTECNESPQNNNVQIEVHDTKDSSIKTPSKSENEKLENPSTPIKISEVNDVPENPKVFSFNWADEVDNVGGEIDTWDSLYDESGNYVLSEACKGKLNDSIADITLHKPAKDYYEFQPKEVQLSDEEYNHIIEIYDFSSTFQSVDLLVIFQQYKGFSLKWVDDTHALGIFSSSVTATDCLNMVHPFVKTRPLSQASEVSKTKAQRLKESRLPFKPRPETSAALARRLVTGALGLRVSVPREQREAEKMKLKNAKEKRKLVAKQKEEAWEGTLGNLAE